MLLEPIAIFTALLLSGVACLHIALALGQPFGHLAWGGAQQTLRTGRRIASAISAIVLFAFACVILIHANVFESVVPLDWTRIALLIFAAQFALNTAANLASKSVPEKQIMGSITVILTLCCMALAWMA